jgi:hypothetical protein
MIPCARRRWLPITAVLWAVPALAVQNDAGVIRGWVLSKVPLLESRVPFRASEPLYGIVIIKGTRQGAVCRWDGSFEVPYVPAGLYALEASAHGYKSKTVKNVHVRPGKTAIVTIQLKRAPPPKFVPGRRPIEVDSLSSPRARSASPDSTR